jgi:MerR family transcriptional regulator, thiopeptide resistance regulator
MDRDQRGEDQLRRDRPRKIGDLARQTGVSVRTLHHYDEIGLLTPSLRSASGHRLYTTGDVVRLQQILSLRQLGFSLQEIGQCLDRPEYSPLKLLELHLARLREQMEQQRVLCTRLEALAAKLRSAEEVSAEEFIQVIEGMTMMEKYYTPEQLAALQARKAKLGEEHIREVEAEWPRLMAQVQTAMSQGVDPASPQVQALAKRWMELVREFTGGDPGITQSLKSMYQREPAVHGMDTGPMRALMEYIQRALGKGA